MLILHSSLDINELDSTYPGLVCWVAAVHRLIVLSPLCFTGDIPETSLLQEHTHEDWARAYHTLRYFNRQNNQSIGQVRAKANYAAITLRFLSKDLGGFALEFSDDPNPLNQFASELVNEKVMRITIFTAYPKS